MSLGSTGYYHNSVNNSKESACDGRKCSAVPGTAQHSIVQYNAVQKEKCSTIPYSIVLYMPLGKRLGVRRSQKGSTCSLAPRFPPPSEAPIAPIAPILHPRYDDLSMHEYERKVSQ